MDVLEEYDDVYDWPLKKTIYFRYGTRIVGATGFESWTDPRVLHLRVHASLFELLVRGILAILPSPLLYLFKKTFPEWTLPRHIIFKIQRERWEDQFLIEDAAYRVLEPLQGDVVPRYYGSFNYDGVRAMILEDIGGKPLSTPEAGILRPSELWPLVERSLTTLLKHGICHEDIVLSNFILVEDGRKDKIVVIGFEHVRLNVPPEEFDLVVKAKTERLVEFYGNYLMVSDLEGERLPLKYRVPQRKHLHHLDVLINCGC